MRGGNRASGRHMRWKGIPGNLVTHFFLVFLFSNVAFGHQRSGDTWLPSCNGSHVRSEKLNGHPCAPSMPLFNFLFQYFSTSSTFLFPFPCFSVLSFFLPLFDLFVFCFPFSFQTLYGLSSYMLLAEYACMKKKMLLSSSSSLLYLHNQCYLVIY